MIFEMWAPIPLHKLEILILQGELELEKEPLNLWNLIKIPPVKWQEKKHGDLGGGFWVVAIFGNEVIYYNDIEDGFNISEYESYGLIKEYRCNQYELNHVVVQLYEKVKNYRDIV